MKTPRFLSGAALLFWGWQTELLLWAVPMAILVELSQFVRARWEFSIADLRRIWNLCAVLFFGAGVILYSSEDMTRVALKFAQWLPFPFFPMMLAQIYGTSEKIPLNVFSWFLRRSPQSALANKSLNISFLYFGICLLAASATSQLSPYFYPGMALLIAVALMTNRPRRLPQPIWILLIVGIGLAGHVGHQQLHALHSTLEGTLARWFVGLFSRQNNFNESRTAIGHVGRIQLSGNIVLRVQPESGDTVPTLLRDTTYDVYKNGVWNSSQNEFAPVFVETNDVAFLQPQKKLNFALRIAGYLNRGRGQLALPSGTYELDNFLGVLETNRMGVAKVREGPGLLNLVANYGPGKTFDGTTNKSDLEVPRMEKQTVAQIVRELNLDGKSDREKLGIIRQFFQNKFTYSLEISRKHIDPSGQKTPLGQFLTVARSGHCEYFATATVLLLREAKIPARYATGYLVDGSERKGKNYLVRERDGHAWVLVYRKEKGIWEEFDTTPASIDRAEKFQASAWEPISDFFSNLKFQFLKWRWSKTSYTSYLKWFLIPLILFLVWRILSKKRRQQNSSKQLESVEPVWPGLDSEFYLFQEKLIADGLGRFPNELLHDWQKRISSASLQPENLDPIFKIHRRLRFDPHGVNSRDREILKNAVNEWLKT